MRRASRFSKFFILTMLSLLLIPLNANAASSAPTVNFTVTPSQSVIVKPANSSAQGSLDIRLSPEGKATNANRSPIDVAFIFDKSGSMDELGRNPYKFLSAKNAMSEAAAYFSQDPNKNDRFALIPFSSDVETDKVVTFPVVATQTTDNVKANLRTINSKAKDLTAVGGTNYTQSMQKAMSMLTTGNSTSKKYIIFMTDGEPTSSKNVETFTDRVCQYKYFCYDKKVQDTVTYTIYTNNTATAVRSNGDVVSNNLNTIQTAIKSQVNEQVDALASNNIKLYSIGFGTNSEVDMSYLRNLSEKTGVTAQQASTDTIAKIFEDISQKVSTPTITTTVKINISKYANTVKLADNANATLDSSGNVVIKKDILFPINQSVNEPIDVSLPLTFSEKGTYTFDNITLEYTDLDGKMQQKTTSATITVKDDAPAGFQSSMTLSKVVNDLTSLVKTSNANDKTNYFNVNYSLKPTNLVNSTVTGKLKDLVIEQPLPAGVSIVPKDNVKQETRNGQNYAIMTLSDVSNYAKGSFSPSEITASMQLKVDWAVTNMTMPLATLNYTDSRFSYGSKTTIPAAKDMINLKVQLKENTANVYTGDAAGTIEKRDQATNTKKASTQDFKEDYGLQTLPVKDMVYKAGTNNQAIEITYNDDSKSYLYFTPDYDLTGTSTGTKYASGAKASEAVEAKLIQKVAGDDVVYSYKIDNGKDSTGWIKFDPNKAIIIDKIGENKIYVKAEGGFANSKEITKTITIEHKIQSIEVTPNPIKITKGSTVDFTVAIKPDNATNKDLDISIGDTSIASILNGKYSIYGEKQGETELIVKTRDGSNLEVRIPVSVTDPYIALDEIKFTKPAYQVEVGEELPVTDNLIFNPSDATDKDIISVVADKTDKVDVIEKGGEYYLVGKDVGYSNVTATAEEQRDKKTPSATTLIEVVKEKDTDDGNNGGSGNSTDGKW